MDFFIGTLMPFPYGFTPQYWLPCNGQLLPIQQNAALFALIGVYYGGDGKTTFALPQLNSIHPDVPTRAAMGQGNGPGLTPRSMGETVGTDAVALASSELPVHTHSFGMPAVAPGQVPSAVPVAGGVLINQSAGTFVQPSQALVSLNPNTIGMMGGGTPHMNDQPWIAVNWCICTAGVFPSRP